MALCPQNTVHAVLSVTKGSSALPGYAQSLTLAAEKFAFCTLEDDGILYVCLGLSTKQNTKFNLFNSRYLNKKKPLLSKITGAFVLTILLFFFICRDLSPVPYPVADETAAGLAASGFVWCGARGWDAGSVPTKRAKAACTSPVACHKKSF